LKTFRNISFYNNEFLKKSRNFQISRLKIIGNSINFFGLGTAKYSTWANFPRWQPVGSASCRHRSAGLSRLVGLASRGARCTLENRVSTTHLKNQADEISSVLIFPLCWGNFPSWSTLRYSSHFFNYQSRNLILSSFFFKNPLL
jgi:hypothetical protein